MLSMRAFRDDLALYRRLLSNLHDGFAEAECVREQVVDLDRYNACLQGKILFPSYRYERD